MPALPKLLPVAPLCPVIASVVLPVVDVNNTIESRPDNSDLIQKASGIML